MAEDGVFAIFTRNSDDYETYPAGADIFREGDTGECLYVVRTGGGRSAEGRASPRLGGAWRRLW